MSETICKICIQITVISLCFSFVSGQPGFLSIDCGSTVNYTDSITGIQWTTDEGYIQTGTSSAIVSKKSNSLDNLTQLWDYRSFDKRNRNCFVVPVENSSTYLVRGTFKLIDVDLLLSDLNFQLFLDSTPWVHVSYSSTVGVGGLTPDVPRVFESIIKPTNRELLVCLVRGQGRPFISALELRKLETGMYFKPGADFEFGRILILAYRVNMGASQGSQVRYPDDDYDRIWHTYDGNCPESITSSKPVAPQPVEYVNDTRYTEEYGSIAYRWITNRVPTKVMEDACVGQDSVLLIQLSFPVTVQQYYGIVYFQEIDDNASDSNVRGMIIAVQNVSGSLGWNVTRTVDEISGLYFTLFDFAWSLTLTKSPWSRLEPMANALEFYIWNMVDNSTTESTDFTALQNLKAGFNLLDYTGDPCFPIPWDWLVCDSNSVPSRVMKVNLSNYGLEGFLDPAIGALTDLTDLLLDNNRLTGVIPDLRRMTKLQRVNLQNNGFSGAFPDYLLETPSLLELNVTGNNLSGAISSCPKAEVSCDENPLLLCSSKLRRCQQPMGSQKVGKLVGGIVGGFVVLSIITVLMVWIVVRRRRRGNGTADISDPDGKKTLIGPSLSYEQIGGSAFFTMDQVVTMINNYENKIGEGSYGAVYLGELPSGKKVAVKVHNASSRQGLAEFMNEVNLLSRVHHRNLVSLLGYCEEQDQQILIYEYLSSGTLREHLYGQLKSTSPLDWKARLNIAIDSAKGLEYLHKDCHPQIIHRDVKSSNILLDEKLVAKVADFGLSKAGPEEGFNSGVSTVLKGTPGYFDPEYFMTQRLTHKSDVYSYGIVLLELLSGLPPHNSKLPDGSSGTLLEWVQKRSHVSSLAIVDANLAGQYSDEVMTKVIDLALSCVELQSVHRPDMEQIVRELTEARASEFPEEQLSRASESVDSFLAHEPSSSANILLSRKTIESTSKVPLQQSEVEYPSSMDVSYRTGR